jgi:Cof subfamily protein (haloacid dehalogenase superfamily)
VLFAHRAGRGVAGDEGGWWRLALSRYALQVIRLVCIDVDGTLVGSSGMVLPQIWDAVDRLRAKGVRLAICSGRPAFGRAREYALRVDVDGWHVFQNGASVLHLATGESLSAALPLGAVAMFVERARRTGRVLELYADKEYAVESDGRLAREHASLLGVPFTPRPFDSLTSAIVRAQWMVPHEETASVLIEPHPGLDAMASTSPVMPDTTFVNFTKAGVGKASGVRSVAEGYGIGLAQVMFVGDSGNDVEAMREVGLPVAMGNADAEVADVARMRVGHVDDAGLAEALTLALTA